MHTNIPAGALRLGRAVPFEGGRDDARVVRVLPTAEIVVVPEI